MGAAHAGWADDFPRLVDELPRLLEGVDSSDAPHAARALWAIR